MSQSKSEKQIGDYLLNEEIGSGGFAKVVLGTHIPTGEKVAIKIMDKSIIFEDDVNKERVLSEISILKIVRHNNIIKLYEVMETPQRIYLVMEYCDNGELFDYIVSKQHLSERQSCQFFQQIIDSLSYLHSQNIVHRDIKPENILLITSGEAMTCKLIDFGISRIYPNDKMISTPCGTASYAPPEMHLGEDYYGLLSDIWSAGVLLYAMVFGYLPFCEEDEDINIQNIVTGNYEIPEEASPDLEDLLKHILAIDPKNRYDLEKIKNHPWYNLVKPAFTRPGIIIGKNKIPIDDRILSVCEAYGFKKEDVRISVEENRYDNNSSIYYIILSKMKKEGYDSISDLYSDDYLNYINDPKNLIENEKKENEENNNNERKLSNGEEKEIKENNKKNVDNIIDQNNQELSQVSNENEKLRPIKSEAEISVASEDKEYNDSSKFSKVSSNSRKSSDSSISNEENKNIDNKVNNNINNIVRMSFKNKEDQQKKLDEIVEIPEQKIEENKEEEIGQQTENKLNDAQNPTENNNNENSLKQEIPTTTEQNNENKINNDVIIITDNNKNDNQNNPTTEEQNQINNENNKQPEMQNLNINQEKPKKRVHRKSNIDKIDKKYQPFIFTLINGATPGRSFLINPESMKIFQQNAIIKEDYDDDKLNNSFSERLTDTLKENLLKLRNPKKKNPEKEKQIAQALQEIKEGKIDVSRVERANSIKQKYKKKDLKKSLKKNEPLFNETEKKDHTIIHNRNASAEANENKNKKIIKSPVKKKEPKEPKETKEKNAMSAQKRKKEVKKINEVDNKNIIRNIKRVTKKNENIPKEKKKEKEEKEEKKNKCSKNHDLSNTTTDMNKNKKRTKTPVKKIEDKNKDKNKNPKTNTNTNTNNVKLNKNKTNDASNNKTSPTKKKINNKNDLFDVKVINKPAENNKKTIRITYKPALTEGNKENNNKPISSDLNKYNENKKIKHKHNESCNISNAKKKNNSFITSKKEKTPTKKMIEVNRLKTPVKKKYHHKYNSVPTNPDEEYQSKSKKNNINTNAFSLNIENSNNNNNNYSSLVVKTEKNESKKKKIQISSIGAKLSSRDVGKVTSDFHLAHLPSSSSIIRNKNNLNYFPMDIKNFFIGDSLKTVTLGLISVLNKNKVKYWKISPLLFYCTKNGENFEIELKILNNKIKVSKEKQESILKEIENSNEKEKDNEESNFKKGMLFYISVFARDSSNNAQAIGLIKAICKKLKEDYSKENL